MKPADRPVVSHANIAGMGRAAPIYFVLAFGLVLLGMVYLWTLPDLGANLGSESTPPATPIASIAPMPPKAANPVTAIPVASQAQATPEADADPTRDISAYIMRGEKPTMPEVIARLQQAGVYGGLAAFSPPGTRPPLIGLAVPEDFVLPQGYVRHHQATDDGQRIEAILMFAPDRIFLDAANKPIVMPKDRVVPPEYAPAGMPIRRIVLPAATPASGRP